MIDPTFRDRSFPPAGAGYTAPPVHDEAVADQALTHGPHAARFEALFHRAPAVTTSAPGRVNLVGEHTDYNDGLVLPWAIPQRTTVALAPNKEAGNGRVRLASANAPGDVAVYELGKEAKTGTWIDYVQGVTFALRQAGAPAFAQGFDATVTSDVPLGSGLSSSAALSIAVLRALKQVYKLPQGDQTLAQIAQRAENDFVGAPVGIMDPMACMFGESHAALYLDTQTLAFERVPLPDAAVDIVVISPGIGHRNSAGEYGQRRAECVAACAALRVASLRELTVADLPKVMALPDPLGRRVRHILTENARVLRAVSAMKSHDAVGLGEVFDGSHRSMRDDYEISIPEIDRLVALARSHPDVFGARLTGGGFGGSIVVLASANRGREVARWVVERAAAGPDRLRARALVPSGPGE